MFLKKALRETDACCKEEILSLIEALKTIISTLPKVIYKLIKEVITLAVKVY